MTDLRHHDDNPSLTLSAVEDRVVAAKNITRLGPKRLSLYLAKYESLELSWATIRNVLHRNRHRLTYPSPAHHGASPQRPFVDWYAAIPTSVGTNRPKVPTFGLHNHLVHLAQARAPQHLDISFTLTTS
mgnify:CR=1 FL=1